MYLWSFLDWFQNAVSEAVNRPFEFFLKFTYDGVAWRYLPMTSPEGFIVVALTSFPDKWEFDLNPNEKPLMQGL